MISFYAEQKGLFTMYLEEEEQLEKMRKLREENPQVKSKHSKKKQSNKRHHPHPPPILTQIPIAQKKQLYHPHKLHRQIQKIASLQLPASDVRRKPVELSQRRSQIFHSRRQQLKPNNCSVQYRVIEQKPIVVPEVTHLNTDSLHKKTKPRNSSNKFRIQQDQHFINKRFLPAINHSPQKSRVQSIKNSQNCTQQAAIQLIMSIMDLENQKVRASKNMSEQQLRKGVKNFRNHRISNQALKRKDDLSCKELTKWDKLRRQIANRYNFPL